VAEEFKPEKNYVVQVSVKFSGTFMGYEEDHGVKYAIFQQDGMTRFGPPVRKVRVDNVISSELIKY
jgi:hypothetical protein